MKKNYKYLKALTWEARNNPSMWVEDPECEELIDYYHPSKNRLNAYQLNGSKTIIYLDDKTYTNMVRADWRDEYEEKEHQKRCVSLDYLYDNFELEVSDSGQLITKDNYYLYCDNQMEIEEDEARDYLINKVKSFVDTLTGDDLTLAHYLEEDLSTREIANKMGVSQNSIMQRKKKLQKYFKNFQK